MYSTTPTASAKVVATRNEKGQFQAGYTLTMIRLTAEKQAQQKAVNASQANRDWLAANGLADVEPDEIFAAR